jgi:undecaprenyl-diphosphatase
VFLLAAVGGEKLTYLVASSIVDRPRPDVPPLGHVFSTSSFPSGHVASAITLYGGLAVAWLWLDGGRRSRPRSRRVPMVLASGVAALALLVALSRTYRGHHHLSDVVWGALLGVAWLWWAWWLVLRPAQPPTWTSRRGP